MKKTFTLISLFILLVLCLTLLLEACGSNGQTSSEMPLPIGTSIATKTQNNEIPQWISLATPYVHVSNYTATIDASISKNLSSQIVSLVQQSVDRYNKLDFSLRKNGKTVSGNTSLSGSTRETASMSYSSDSTATPTPCNWEEKETDYWWGKRVFMNHCAVSQTTDVLEITAAIAGLAALFGVPTEEMAAELAIDAGAMKLADDHCGDNGIYYNENWFGDHWVWPIC